MTFGSSAGSHAYGEPSYWDNRYRHDPGPFDWYQRYETLAPLLERYLLRSHRVLLVGCGNSVLGEGMVDDGYQDVVNIDISSVVVKAMQEKYLDKPALKYIIMDVRNMSYFESGSFDAVIDKGTLDSLMCGHNAQHNATKMLEEIGRVLKDKGVYILITYGDPTYRLHLLRELALWTISLHVIEQCQTLKGLARVMLLPIVVGSEAQKLQCSRRIRIGNVSETSSETFRKRFRYISFIETENYVVSSYPFRIIPILLYLFPCIIGCR